MSFDEMKNEDFSRIRWDRMRWDFVDLMISAANLHADRPRSFLCTANSCCIEMQQIGRLFGFEIQSNDDDQFFGSVEFKKSLQSQVTPEMRDGMSMVSTYIQFGTGHPLRGYSEVPWEVGRVIHSSYFTNANRDDNLAPHVSDDPADEIRELLYAFVKLAFPDDFMAAVHQKNSGESFEQPFALEETWFGEGLAWKRLIIRPFFGEPGLIQGFLMESEYPGVDFHEIDLSHVRSLNQAIREIRGIDLAMFDRCNPLQGASMERNKVWEGQGLLWQNLALYETTEGYIGVLSNSKSFMPDREMKFGIHINSEEAIKAITDEDSDFYDELTLHADEG
jgi:hypothetical protein